MLPHLQLYAWKAFSTLLRIRVISQWERCQFSSFSKTLGNRWTINTWKASVKPWNDQSHLGSDFSDLLRLWVMTVKNETRPLTHHQKLENWSNTVQGCVFFSFLLVIPVSFSPISHSCICHFHLFLFVRVWLSINNWWYRFSTMDSSALRLSETYCKFRNILCITAI